MINVIDYMPSDTLLHRLNPVVKLGLAAAIIVGIFLSDTYVALLGFLALTLALGAYAGVVDRLLALLKLLIPLALIMLVLQLAFMRDGNMVWGFITDTGLITGSKACLRLLGVALPLILMLMVTKLNDLANACVEVLHVPYRYAFTFTTALRFVPCVFLIADRHTNYCAVDLLKRLKEESSIWCTVVTNDPEIAKLGDTSVLLPEAFDGIRAVFAGAVFGQMFSCLCSLSRGYNPDCPKGVSKQTVTV